MCVCVQSTCPLAGRCVNSQDTGAVFLQQEVGEIFKDRLAVQGHKLFSTDLTGGKRSREKCTLSYSALINKLPGRSWPTKTHLKDGWTWNMERTEREGREQAPVCPLSGKLIPELQLQWLYDFPLPISKNTGDEVLIFYCEWSWCLWRFSVIRRHDHAYTINRFTILGEHVATV